MQPVDVMWACLHWCVGGGAGASLGAEAVAAALSFSCLPHRAVAGWCPSQVDAPASPLRLLYCTPEKIVSSKRFFSKVCVG